MAFFVAILLLMPAASAKVIDETGVCIKSECKWVDNNGEIHNCESNGNVAIINGHDNRVNYCHDETS